MKGNKVVITKFKKLKTFTVCHLNTVKLSHISITKLKIKNHQSL